MNAPDLILYNGKITTLNDAQPQVSAVAMSGGRITATGGEPLAPVSRSHSTSIQMHAIHTAVSMLPTNS
jgi:predicted amidohydrolase YtcJ